jgi:hypothetical protein
MGHAGKETLPRRKSSSQEKVQGVPFRIRKRVGSAILPRQVQRKEGEEEMNADALEHAWNILKGKKNAPNYRKATGPKKCGNCKAWDSSATSDPMTGYCEWYDFTCRADHVCDAWAGGGR